jgi:hypothetical protein
MKKLLVVAGSLVLVGALAFAGITYAQTPEPPADTEDGAGLPWGGPGRGLFGGPGPNSELHEAKHEAMQNALAAALGLTRAELDERLTNGERLDEIAEAEGVTQAELAEAMQAAREAAIADAVAQGLITQEQADAMLAREGEFGFGFGRRHGGPGGPGGFMGGGPDSPMHDVMHDAIAAALGLTRDELDTRLADGERLDEIAEAEGLSDEEFAQALTDAHESALAEAVAQGLITQEQADAMLERGFMPGGHHGPGMGGWRFAPGNPDAPDGAETPEAEELSA